MMPKSYPPGVLILDEDAELAVAARERVTIAHWTGNANARNLERQELALRNYRRRVGPGELAHISVVEVTSQPPDRVARRVVAELMGELEVAPIAVVVRGNSARFAFVSMAMAAIQLIVRDDVATRANFFNDDAGAAHWVATKMKTRVDEAELVRLVRAFAPIPSATSPGATRKPG
jgi:hypothetical protein